MNKNQLDCLKSPSKKVTLDDFEKFEIQEIDDKYLDEINGGLSITINWCPTNKECKKNEQ